MIFFADLTPKKFYHHEGTAKNNVFVMTLLHGGRQGGRRGPFLAKKVHFWPKISFWHSPKRSDFFSPDPVVISKYQNLPMYPFQKCLSYAIFLSILDLPERNYM